MKYAFRALFAALAICAAAGCAKTSVDVAAQVKQEMQEELVKKTGLKGLVVEDVVLVKERTDGIDYKGVATGKVDGEEVKFDVTCKYDGHSLIWNAELSEGCLAVLAAKEKAKEICAKLKGTWPQVKEGVKQASDAVVKAAENAGEAVAKAAGDAGDAVAKTAGETYDAAKKKAGEIIDKAKTAVTNIADEAKQKISDAAESVSGAVTNKGE